MAISMLKIRRPLGRLIFNMGIAIPGKTVFLIETAPRFIRDTLVFICALSDVRSFVLTQISNENRKLSHATPEAATKTPEAATLATILFPVKRGVLVLPNWDNTFAGS